MKVTVTKTAGFCRGVRRAADTIEALLDQKGMDERVLLLGELIHNHAYTAGLAARGAETVTFDELRRILDAPLSTPLTAVIRAHGIAQKELSYLEERARVLPHFSLCDMTCPAVKRIHQIAMQHSAEDTVFLLFADGSHPEPMAAITYAVGEKHFIRSVDDVKMLNFDGKIPILCAQTTQNLVEFLKIKKFLKKVCTNAKIFDTICNVTEMRQNEVRELASSCDSILVVGDRHSSNTRKLYDIAHGLCRDTYLIENARELDLVSLSGKKHIGITAGASTPDLIITEVYKTMTHSENFETMLEESLTTLHTGETVTGTVFAVTDKEIHLDLGTKFTGVIEKEQITDDASAKLSEMFKVGDEVTAFVIRVKDGDGVATLSKKRVDADKSWLAFKDASENGTVMEGVVTAVVKGGVTMSVCGNRVFVPASQTGIPKDGDMSVLVGTTQKIKLIEFDAAKKKVLGSIKVVLNEEKRAREEAIWASLEVGKHYEGTVKNLTPYGAFVDIGGVDGMVHNTELSWKRIKHPSQVVKVGQVIDVFIKELDLEKKRISLGYKTQENDTWFQFTQKYQVGDVVSAKIVSLMPFGAFAEVYEDVDGLIHISRISTQRINSPAEVLSVGDVVDVKIVEIDDENRKLALSIRALTEAAERAAAAEARAAEQAERDAEAQAEAERLEQERADMAPYIVGSI